MPHRIAERIREAAVKCTRLSRSCKDQTVARELETVVVELTEAARDLDQITEQA